MLSCRSLKVATPSTALTVVVPSKVAPEVPLPEVIETVTLGLVEVTRLPSKSVTRTTVWEAIGLPVLELDG